MNFLLLCSLLLLVASSGFSRPSFSNSDVVCPESEDGFPVFLPHPSDCTKYYQCQEDWPILMECAPPLYFDPDLGVCNWPRFVDCQQASTTAEATTEAPVTTAADTTTPEAFNTTTTEAVDTTTPEAIDTTTAEAVDTTTAEVVDTTTSEAVDTTTAEAVDTTTPEAAPSTTEEVVDTTTVQAATSDDTRGFRRSVNMAADEASTEADETTTKAAETTEPAQTTTAEATTAVFDAVCPEEIFLSFVPHPDCNKYYECAWGVPILMSCPPTLYFDPKLNVCNYPDQVDCQMPSTTEAAPSTTEEVVDTTTPEAVSTTTTEAEPSTTEEVVDTTTPEAVDTTTAEDVDTTTSEVVDTTTAEAVDTTTAEAVDTTTSEAVETTSAIMLKRKMNGENTTTEASTPAPPTTSTQMTTNATDAPTTTDMETTAPTNVPTTTTDVPAVECPESVDGFPVFVPHPTDCTKYYECQKDWPILMECAPPLYFDPSISACNWPSQVDCQ